MVLCWCISYRKIIIIRMLLLITARKDMLLQVEVIRSVSGQEGKVFLPQAGH